jgi:large subunit ribosomal protein L41
MVFATAPLLARAAKRLGFTRLTTKRARKGYYKGKGAKSTGRHTKDGEYVVTAEKAPTFVTPRADLATFPLKPYVARIVPKRPWLLGKEGGTAAATTGGGGGGGATGAVPPGAAYSTIAGAPR